MLAHAFTALVALSAPLLAIADVTPSEPGPGDIFNAGATCPIVWLGDKDSTTAWKDMAIELMTGDNLNMIHITTVATGQDGTVDGRFEWPCPQVNPYSAIYFYQFSSPHTTVKTWVTRFTIASPTGQTTPPANATQPGSNDAIPWGVGALVDPSKATPPPTFTGAASPTGSFGTGGVNGTAGTGSGTNTGAGSGPGNSGAGTPSPVASTPPASRSSPVSQAKTSPSPTPSNNPAQTGAASILGVDSRLFVAIVAVFSAAIAW
jgi:hypothetical protein